MMAGIALVAAEIDRTRHPYRQVGVDLDQAVGVALVPVIAGPTLARDELEIEALLLREGDMLDCAGAAFGGGGAHHRFNLARRDDVAILEGIDPLPERTRARHQRLDLRQHRIIGG
jgi:hypothetical protein